VGGFESGRDNPHYDSTSGGPSRYFYTSKASRSERTADGTIPNDHPTVKPLDLMEWLVRLVTREGQTVLDPFAGSGTTCKAAKDIGRAFVGVEQQAKYADIARARVGLSPADPSHVRDDDAQRGVEEFV
jgi:site-specific DNA-methyltransferase (adenine-specific)